MISLVKLEQLIQNSKKKASETGHVVLLYKVSECILTLKVPLERLGISF